MIPRQKAAKRAEEIGKMLTEDSLPAGNRKVLEREMENIGDNEQFWDRLDERAHQYLTDIDSSDFMDEAQYFVKEPCDFSGQDSFTAEKIKDWIGQRCGEAQGMSLQQIKPPAETLVSFHYEMWYSGNIN